MTTKLITLPIKPLAPLGLNLQGSGDTTEPGWARQAFNLVYGDTGELQVREGCSALWASPTAWSSLLSDAQIHKLHCYIDTSGYSRIVGLHNSAGSGTLSAFEVYGGVAASNSGSTFSKAIDGYGENISPQFINFNGKCIVCNLGDELAVKSGSGNFADISLTGSAQPTTATSAILSAYGRVWALDGQTLKYSDLLDETAWNGSYSLAEYWNTGTDVGVGLAEFNGNIIVFGKSNILIYDASLGPDNLVKVESIGGIGCTHKETIQQVGDDIWFLAKNGLQSLSRTIVQKSMPTSFISNNINDFLLSKIDAVGQLTGVISSTYCPLRNFYILTISQSGKNSSDIFIFDTRVKLQDGSYRVTRWSAPFTTCCVDSQSGELILGRTSESSGTYTSGVYQYGGYCGDFRAYQTATGGNSIWFRFQTGWTDLSYLDPAFSSKLKILKSMSALVYCDTVYTETGNKGFRLGWSTDFNADDSIATMDYDTAFTIVDDDTYTVYKTPMSNSGKYVSFGIYNINGTDSILNEVRLNSINVQLKIGKDVL